MQQMAVTDLNNIKGNIMSMNRFLPEKFITDKLRENKLWVEDFPPTETKPFKVAQVRSIM